MTTIYWLIAFVVFVGIEIATMALTTIWFAGGAFIAFLLSLFGVGIQAQLAVFVVASFVLLFLTRPFAAKYINRNTVKTNIDGLIGKPARVTAAINNDAEAGSAVVGGQEWSARAQKDTDYFAVDDIVIIKEIRGVKLIVAKEQKED